MNFTFFIMTLLHPYFKGCKNMLKQYKGIVLAQVILYIMRAIFSAVQCFIWCPILSVYVSRLLKSI